MKYLALALSLVGTLVVLVSPIVALGDGLFSGGITLLAGTVIAVLWKD